MYTTFNIGCRQSNVLLPPANFNGAKVVAATHMLQFHYQTIKGEPLIEYHCSLAVRWYREWETYGIKTKAVYMKSHIYST